MNATWTTAVIDFLLFFYVLDCAFMGLLLMLQRSKQEGLGAAFAGNIMSEFAGAKTSAVLVKATVWAAIIFFVLSITLARLYSHRAVLIEQGSPVQQLLEKPVTPATPATPAPASSTTPTPATPAATPAATTSTPAPAAPAKPAATPAPATPASK